MLVNKRKQLRGDTLVEVLFAMAVFSLVAVGSLSIMNQGASAAQRSLEITLVRQEIDAQAETLRFLNASYVSAYRSGISSYPGTPANEWQYIKAKANTNTSSLDSCTPSENSFILDTRTAKVSSVAIGSAQTYSQVTYNTDNSIRSAEGIWIEAISSTTSNEASQKNTGYVDFYIRACWDSPGQTAPVTLDTIVRLYEPRG